MINVSSFAMVGNERKYVLDCLYRGWLSNGPYVSRLEAKLSDVFEVDHVVACSSGTAALHLALLALGIGQNDSVVVPAMTYVATANAARYCGASVCFSDIDPSSWTMAALPTPQATATSITITVDMYDAVAPIGFIRDASHSIGALRGDNLGTIATFSFFASKIVACGEGGALLTNDRAIAERARLYRGQGATIPGVYYHEVVGYNYRMTDLQAAIALAQLEQIDRTIARRRSLIDRYRKNLDGSGLLMQGGERASGWAFGVVLPSEVNRDAVATLLRESSIETRPFFIPIPALPSYATEVPPVAKDVAARGLVLPVHLFLSNDDVDKVCGALLSAIDMEASCCLSS